MYEYTQSLTRSQEPFKVMNVHELKRHVESPTNHLLYFYCLFHAVTSSK